MEIVWVIFTNDTTLEVGEGFPAKTAERKARKFLKDSYEPSFSEKPFQEPFTGAYCEEQGWSLTIDSDLRVWKN